MEGLIKDRTLWVVEGAYTDNPSRAQQIHQQILKNDMRIAELARAMCGLEL